MMLYSTTEKHHIVGKKIEDVIKILGLGKTTYFYYL